MGVSEARAERLVRRVARPAAEDAGG
jgi:hypothetical protein